MYSYHTCHIPYIICYILYSTKYIQHTMYYSAVRVCNIFQAEVELLEQSIEQPLLPANTLDSQRSRDFSWFFVFFNNFPWFFVTFRDFPWFSVTWLSVTFRDFPWLSVTLRDFSWRPPGRAQKSTMYRLKRVRYFSWRRFFRFFVTFRDADLAHIWPQIWPHRAPRFFSFFVIC